MQNYIAKKLFYLFKGRKSASTKWTFEFNVHPIFQAFLMEMVLARCFHDFNILLVY